VQQPRCAGEAAEPFDGDVSHLRGPKIAITFAVIGTVIGEFVGSEDGLG
jgi:hypothetical protein